MFWTSAKPNVIKMSRVIALSLLATSLLLTLPSVTPMGYGQAPTVVEPVVSSLNLNGQMNVDLEMIQWSDGSFSLPIKYLANIMDASPEQEHQSGAVTFTDPRGAEPVRVDVAHQQITQGTTVFENFTHPLVWVEDGLFSDREIYVDKALVEQLLNVSLALNEKSQSVELSTSRELKVFLRASIHDNAPNAGQPNPADTMPIAQPLDDAQLVEKINLDLTTATFDQRQKQAVFGDNKAQTIQIFNMGSTLLTGVEGTLFGQNYHLSPRWNYRQGVFGLADLQWGIQHDWPNKRLTLGSMMPGLSPLVAPNIPIWGVQLAAKNALNPAINPQVQRSFEGTAPGRGPLVLELNGQVILTRQPVAGRYAFENIPLLAETVNTVRIVQRHPDGTETVVCEQTVPYFTKTLHHGERAYSTIVGKNPIRPAYIGTENSEWFFNQSNKWLAGSRVFYGVSDKLTLGVAAAGDLIIGSPQTNAFSLLINRMDTPDLTGYAGYRRDPNFFNGGSIGSSLTYRMMPRVTLTADLAGSNRNEYAPESFHKMNAFGNAQQASINYEGKVFYAQAKAFHYSPNYYTPITVSDNNLFDRQGVSLTGNMKLLGFLFQGGVEHYLTNLSGYFEGGKIAVNRWNTSLSRRLGHLTDLRASYNKLLGSNDARELNTENMQVGISQKLPLNMQGNVNYIRSTNSYFFNPGSPLNLLAVDNQTILNSFLQSSLSTRLPWGLGAVSIGNVVSREFNLLSLQGSIRMRHILLEPLIQASMGGEQKLLTLGTGLYYEWDNGRRFGFRYSYSNTTLPSALMGNGTNNATHQFQMDFNDTLAVLGNNLLSVGKRGSTSGILQGSVFLDLNQNGVRDHDETGIPKIAVLIDGNRTIETNQTGSFTLTSLSPGLHSVNYDLEKLSLNMTPTIRATNAQIVAGKRTRVDLGIIVTPGTVSGKVHLKDANGNMLNPADLIVLLCDDQGKEIKFTYTDPKGNYSMSELPPGTYTLKLDAKQADLQHNQVITSPYQVAIPVDYEGFHEKSGMDFEVLQVFRTQ